MSPWSVVTLAGDGLCLLEPGATPPGLAWAELVPEPELGLVTSLS